MAQETGEENCSTKPQTPGERYSPDEVFRVIEQINREGVTVLVVEQNVAHALRACTRAYILETGRTTLQGTGNELLENDYVKEVYLGL